MTIFIKEAIVGVAVCWIIAGYSIWKWGPGLRKRSVRCPERKLRARVLADQREAEFGCLRVIDVKTCSLLSPAHPECSKQCRASFYLRGFSFCHGHGPEASAASYARQRGF